MSPSPDPTAHAPRIGLGWDRHAMQPGRSCVLAGCEIESPVGPTGHSDGDAVLHALTDALLGAAGMDDLGTLFPDDDPRWKGARSGRFVEEALQRVRAAGWLPASADVVVVCDRPRIAPHRARLRERMAALLGLPAERVNLKGKTTEGAEGPERVEATAVVLLIPA